jgi:hypothetical protein
LKEGKEVREGGKEGRKEGWKEGEGRKVKEREGSEGRKGRR